MNRSGAVFVEREMVRFGRAEDFVGVFCMRLDLRGDPSVIH